MYYQQPQAARPVMQQQQLGLKGHPVSSLEEVRASAVDFDGSIFYFPSLANDKIYTKQINLDGTSSLKVYELVETPAATPQLDLVTKQEFTQTINSLLEEISALKKVNRQEEVNKVVEQQPVNFNF